MGTLLETSTGLRSPLRESHLIGRSRGVDLRIDEPAVSGQHALLRWTGERWELRDLGSRNGTWLDDRRLAPGERAQLTAGAKLGFGNADLRWTLIEDRAPLPVAVAEDSGEVCVGEGGLLSLPPGSDAPELLLFRGEDGEWQMERHGDVVPAPDEVEVEGRTWRLSLPQESDQTLDRSAPSVANLSLHFEVSADEEFAQIFLDRRGQRTPLEARVHHYLLLTLARQRQRDAQDGGPEAGHGWVHQSELAHMLRIEESQVNLQIFRARRQLADAGVEDAAHIVERRTPGRQLRLGVAAFDITVV